MGNETTNPGQWQQTKPLGTGEGESPMMNTAQSPRVEARTMGSDISSTQTGDVGAKTYTPQQTSVTPPPGAPTEKTADLGPQSFELPKIDVEINQQTPMEPTKKKSGVFVALIVAIVIVGLAALGYFVVYPLFFGESEPIPTVSTAPEPQALPITPPTEEVTTTTTPEAPAPEEGQPSHVSVFKTPADVSMENASVVTGGSLTNVTFSSPVSPSITEVINKDATGNLVSFGTIMQTIFGGDFSSGILSNAFPSAKVSEFIFTNANGDRVLGIVAEADSTTSLADLKTAFAQTFEASQGLAGVFATDPGTPGLWKDGQTGGVQNRYLTFSNPGFSINYGWSGNVLVISGSYEGFKAALQRLQ